MSSLRIRMPSLAVLDGISTFFIRSTFTPLSLSPALWLDAADSSTITQASGLVSQWNDKSGNANNFAQATPANQPIYEPTGNSTGGAALSFNGTTQFINGNIVSPTQLRNFTSLNVFMVFQTAIAAAPEVNSAITFGLFRSATTNISYFWASITGLLTGESLTYIRNINDRLGSSTYTRAANTMQIFNTQNATTGTTVFANGSSVNLNLANAITTSTDTSPLAAALGNDNFTLFGTGGPDNVASFAAKVSEVLVFNANLSTTNRQLVEGYLAWKWGLQASLPVGHPYKIIDPNGWNRTSPWIRIAGVWKRAIPYIKVAGVWKSVAFDVDALTYITAVETADGASLETGVKLAINNFVVGCKTDGIWGAIKASCILAGARTLNGALVPLVGTAPTNFNFVTGDYNRKTGLLGDGSTKYLNSNRNNNIDPQNNRHASVYATTRNTEDAVRMYMGAVVSTVADGDMQIFSSNTASLRLLARLSTQLTQTSVANLHAANGLFAVTRNNGTNYIIRGSGINETQTVASDANNALSAFVFARNLDGAVNSHSNGRLAFYSIGESLDLALLDARVTALINAYAAAIP